MQTVTTKPQLAVDGGTPVRRTPFPSWPVFDQRERDALIQVLESGQWSAADAPQVSAFEREFAAVHQARHGITAVNGTTTLVIALQALGIGAGDEVIVPPYTFVATATAVLTANALPIFADIDPNTYCLDPIAAEAAITPRTKAIIPVHLAGHPADMDAFLRLRERYGVAIVEDAAHAHGGIWKDRKVGAIGDFGSFSFQASKNLTSGEGGILLTNDDDLAAAARSLHNCGRRPSHPWYEHFILAGNHRLTEFQAALLRIGLTRLEEQTQRRDANGRYLNKMLGAIPGITPQVRADYCTRHSQHLYVFRYDSTAFGGHSREEFIAALTAEGIPCSVGYPFPLYRNPLFTELRFDTQATGYDPNHAPTAFDCLHLSNTEAACRETVWFTQNMLLGTESDMADVVAAVEKIQAAWRK